MCTQGSCALAGAHHVLSPHHSRSTPGCSALSATSTGDKEMQPQLCFPTDSWGCQPSLKAHRISYMLANCTRPTTLGNRGCTGAFTLLGTRDRKQGPQESSERKE